MNQLAPSRSLVGSMQHLLREVELRRLRPVVVAAVLLAAIWMGPMASRPIVALLFGLPITILVLRQPRWQLPILLLACAFLPFRLRAGAGAAITLAMPGVAGLTGLWLVASLLRRDLRLRASPANRPWFVLILVAGTSVVAGAALWSPWVVTASDFILVQGAQWAIIALSGCAYWLGANYLRDRDQLQQIVAAILLLGLAFICLGYLPFLNRFGQRFFLVGPTFRICVVCLAAGMALGMPSLERRLRWAMGFLAIGMVALPWWRSGDWASGWLPSLIALSTVFVVWTWDRMQWRVLPYASFAALTSAFLLLPSLSQTDYYSLDTRRIAWQGLVELLDGRWMLGLGLASYWHYWRGVLGSISYWDPTTGYLHYTFDPEVNLHNNYLDVLGQMGILGLVVLLWLLAAIALHLWRSHLAEPAGFGRAYATAAIGILVGMSASGMLGDWFMPFVYNVGLQGFHDSFIGWLLLGGVVVLQHDRPRASDADPDGPDPPAEGEAAAEAPAAAGDGMPAGQQPTPGAGRA